MDRTWMSVKLICNIINDVIDNSDYSKEFKVDFAKRAVKDLKEIAEYELESNP